MMLMYVFFWWDLACTGRQMRETNQVKTSDQVKLRSKWLKQVGEARKVEGNETGIFSRICLSTYKFLKIKMTLTNQKSKLTTWTFHFFTKELSAIGYINGLIMFKLSSHMLKISLLSLKATKSGMWLRVDTNKLTNLMRSLWL